MTTTAVRPAAPPPVVLSRSWVPDVLRQSATLAGRGVTKTVHSTEALLDVTLQPVIFLLLFVYVFGATMGAGIGGGGRGEYANYITPGILLITIASTAQGTAIAIAMDMTEGIIARFRTMAIHRPSVLTGHAAGGTDEGGDGDGEKGAGDRAGRREKEVVR